MYRPPFSINDNTLALLGETNMQLPHTAGAMLLDEATLIQEHSRLGGDGTYRITGENPHWIPVLVHALLEWVNNTPTHPLIRAAVFTCEFLRISPFSVGNKILAQSLLRRLLISSHPVLSKMQFTPEIKCALAAINATELIPALLHAILATLRQKSPGPRTPRQQTTPIEQIVAHIRRHPGCKRPELLTALPGISARMLDRHLQTLRESGRIEYRGSRKTGAYYAP